MNRTDDEQQLFLINEITDPLQIVRPYIWITGGIIFGAMLSNLKIMYEMDEGPVTTTLRHIADRAECRYTAVLSGLHSLQARGFITYKIVNPNAPLDDQEVCYTYNGKAVNAAVAVSNRPPPA